MSKVNERTNIDNFYFYKVIVIRLGQLKVFEEDVQNVARWSCYCPRAIKSICVFLRVVQACYSSKRRVKIAPAWIDC